MEGKIKYLNGLNQDKHYVIMGNPGSGKTRLAKLMAEKLCEKHEFVIIDGSEDYSYFQYAKCNENTKVVICDDVENIEWYNLLTEGITVHRQCEKPIFIKPKIILTTDIIKEVKESIEQRFNFIEIL